MEMPRLSLLCSFTGESMNPFVTMAYSYYKEGAENPTFLFPIYALEEMKCLNLQYVKFCHFK